jgi:DNA-binding NtrC family response regulator
MPNRRVLILDDERLVRWSLGERLRADGYEPVPASSVAEAIEIAAKGVDAAILDYALPDGDGVSVLKRLHHLDPDLPVIMLTANQNVDVVVEAVKAGASDYVAKPFELHDVALRLSRAIDATKSSRELRRLKEDLARPFSFESMIGESEPMQRVRALARKVAQTPSSTVLLTGESGTGKDLLAKVVHYASARANRPFMNITCSALPETLLESELFGHERGAFTDARQQKRGLFEQADQGTVFLDEIGETPPTLQAKLLRFLEEKAFRRLGSTADIKVDVRVIAATNRDLEQQVQDGKFREDLYYRLNVLRIPMPPLRERGQDIVLLARHYIGVYSQEFRRPVRGLSPEAEQALLAYRWPGNVRELRNVIERAVLLAEGDLLQPVDFDALHAGALTGASAATGRAVPPSDGTSSPAAAPAPHADGPLAAGGGIQLPPEGLHLDEVEKHLITLALERTRGNQTRAASLLGLHRDQIRYRMEKYGLLKPAP